MENYYLEKTEETPGINFNINGTFSIEGKSYPENSLLFFQPMLNWTKDYLLTQDKNITLDFEIIYFNSSSSRQICDFFDLLNKHSKKVKINWIYDYRNESSLEAGQDFIEEFKDLDIELISKS